MEVSKNSCRVYVRESEAEIDFQAAVIPHQNGKLIYKD